MVYHWARKRSEDYWYTMHKDWTLGDFQLGIRRFENDITTLEIRKRKGRFGVSDWEIILKSSNDKRVCDNLRHMLKNVSRLDETYDLLVWRRKRKKKEEKLAQYCGYDPDGKLW